VAETNPFDPAGIGSLLYLVTVHPQDAFTEEITSALPVSVK
jgi:hypothetical protein